MSVGVVAAAAPQGVFPWHLAASFTPDENWDILVNSYVDGECQKRALVADSRKAFTLAENLSAAQLIELREFWATHETMVPFYFYDVTETVNFAYDASGVSTVGRYIMRFDMPFQTTFVLGRRGQVSLRLIEVA